MVRAIRGLVLASLVAAVLLAILGLAIGYEGVLHDQHQKFGSWEQLYRRNSSFGMLQVLQREGQRRYYNDFLLQNTYDTAQKRSLSMFTYMLHDLARAYTPSITNVLCIGLGIGIVPRQFAQEGARVDVIEINPAVVPVAATYFDLDPRRLNIT